MSWNDHKQNNQIYTVHCGIHELTGTYVLYSTCILMNPISGYWYRCDLQSQELLCTLLESGSASSVVCCPLSSGFELLMTSQQLLLPSSFTRSVYEVGVCSRTWPGWRWRLKGARASIACGLPDQCRLRLSTRPLHWSQLSPQMSESSRSEPLRG